MIIVDVLAELGGAPVEYRILGPLEVTGDNPVDLGGRTQRTLLAVLLANAGRLVSLPYLVDAVWDERPPGTARRQIQNYVAALRRGLTEAGAGESVIETVESGYRLRPGPGELDAEVFADRVTDAQRLADANHREEAAARLRSALELWRGPALFGLTGRAVEAAAAALDEQRLAAVEHRLDLELALGRQHDLVGELTELVATHPLRERLVGQLMLALHGTGRQPQALEVYARHREVLAEELGLDPGGALRQIHAAVLGAGGLEPDPAPPATAAPAQLPPDVAGFTGRFEPLKTLDDVLPDVDGPATAVVVAAIAGPPGVGKTALAVHWGHRVRAHFPDGQLYVNLRGHAATAPMSALEALTHLMRSLGMAPEEIDSADAELAAGQYRSLLARRRVLVVLDDAAGVDQVRPLLPAGAGSMVLVTSRIRLTGLAARDGARLITLDVLDAEEALDLLTHMLGPERVAAEPDAAAELARACSHLPLALRIAAANAFHHPSDSLADRARTLRERALTALEVTDDDQASVRRAFDLSYEALPAATRALFRRIGIVAAPEVSAEAAAALTGMPSGDAASELERLAAAHLVFPTHTSGGPGRYAGHDLLRQFAAERARDEEPAPEREAGLRRLVDWYLRCADTAASLLYPHRLRLPVPPIEAAAPVPFADQAGALAWLDAERRGLVATIRQAAEQGLREPTAERGTSGAEVKPRSLRAAAWLLADTIRAYFWLRVHTADWAETAAVALAAARAEGDVRAEVAALLSLGDTADRQHRRDEAIEHYTRAGELADRVGWVDASTAALGKLGSLLLESGRLRESADHYRRALAANADGGSPHAQAVVLGSLGSIHFQLGELDEANAHYGRTLALFRQIGSVQGEAAALDALGEVLLAQGRLGEATERLTAALRLEREVGDRGTEASSLRTLAAVYRDAGQTVRAAEVANAVVALATELDDRRLEAEAHNVLGTVRHHAGRHWEAIDHHRHALELSRRTGYRYTEVEALLGAAAAHAGLGEDAPARDHAERALTIAEEIGFARLAGRARDILAAVV
jgi:DNA-binding SARP family transcriptional activator/Tfp pilus assembly protein PilF